MVECLGSGWIQKQIARRAYEYQRALERGEVTVVGVNRFKSEGEGHEVELPSPSREAIADRLEVLKDLRAWRDGQAVRSALASLERAARGTANLMPSIRQAVRVQATVGEIAGTLRKVFGRYQPPTGF
jgi:methylmalonyl-CoA mutase N-terminal domain/subunit